MHYYPANNVLQKPKYHVDDTEAWSKANTPNFCREANKLQKEHDAIWSSNDHTNESFQQVHVTYIFRGSPSTTYVLFANESFLFCKTTVLEMKSIDSLIYNAVREIFIYKIMFEFENKNEKPFVSNHVWCHQYSFDKPTKCYIVL